MLLFVSTHVSSFPSARRSSRRGFHGAERSVKDAPGRAEAHQTHSNHEAPRKTGSQALFETSTHLTHPRRAQT